MSTEKISADQLAALWAEVPGTLRKLASERDHFQKLAESYQRKEQATKVAHAMHARGIHAEVSLEDLIGNMEKAAQEGKLQDIERAVNLVGPDMGAKLASLADDSTTEATAEGRFYAAMSR